MAQRNEGDLDFAKWCEDHTYREIGALMVELVRENQHNGWDAWDRHDLTGIRKFFADAVLYANNRGEDDPLATTTYFTGSTWGSRDRPAGS